MKGKPLSRGQAIGPLVHLKAHIPQGPALSIHPSKVDREIARYRLALTSSKRDLESLQNGLTDEASDVIDSHIEMLDDPLITTEMEEHIRDRLFNTETVFNSVMEKYEQILSSRADDFFKERLLDVRDVSRRIMSHLGGVDSPSPKERSVIYAHELGPSDIIDLAPHAIAFVTQKGGGSSHSALIARAKHIPFVAGVDLSEIPAGTPILVDGGTGEITLNPKQEAKQTKDNKIDYPPEVTLFVNANDLSDIDGSRPIGLFRTEFPYLGRDIALISEDEQYSLYRQIVEKANGHPTTLRLFDVGGDKLGPHEELNPALGERGIRFLLKNTDIFRRQLRAILRVSHFGPINLLIPMVTDVSQVLATKELFFECQSEVGGTLALGSMIEIPSAAILADELAKECDFLSIGTNDLTQYVLASCRNTGSVYDQMHPAVLKLIGLIIDLAGDTPVTLCGDIATNPDALSHLLKLGVTRLSIPQNRAGACSPTLA